MADTYYGAKANPAKNEAYSYDYAGQWIRSIETDMSIPGGAGAIVSTPTDLVKFIDALFAGKLVSPASLELMKTVKDKYGMAMYPIQFDDKKAYGHGGDIDGFHNELFYFPHERLAIAYTCNGMRNPTHNVVVDALSIYFSKPYAIPEFKESKTITLNTAELDKYVGKYSSMQAPLKFDITKNNTTLFAGAAGRITVPLEAKGNDKFVFVGAGATFQFEPVKKTFTFTQGGKTYLFTKAD